MIPKVLETDVCIVGAGPSGATCSFFLSKNNVSHILLDKASFPREKVCGDALTIEAIHVLKLMNPNFLKEIYAADWAYPIWNFRGEAPNEKVVRFDFNPEKLKYAPLCTIKRSRFDQFLFEKTSSIHCNSMLRSSVIEIKEKSDFVEVLVEKEDGEQLIVKCNMLVGADGERSIVSKKMAGDYKKDRAHSFASVRAYYQGVSFPDGRSDLEFYFLEELLPGYFWIFPMADNTANVGLTYLGELAQNKKVNLKRLLEDIIASPKFKDRFKTAVSEEGLKGWSLPLNSKRKSLSGDRYMLLGDAGSLIEPLTGKGIGLAMISGRIAAKHIVEAVKSKDFSALSMKKYEDDLSRMYSREWDIAYYLQRKSKQKRFPNLMANLFHLPLVEKFVTWMIQTWLGKWM